MVDGLRYDAVIVGGSVAGAATALHLARRGRRVALLDRALFPRDKPCGEGLMPHGVAALAELGLLERALPHARALSGIRYRLPGGRSAYAPFPARQDGFVSAVGIRRQALDALLHAAAAAEPRVDVRDGFCVRTLRRSAGGYAEVGDGHERVRARVVVGADGLHSRVRTLLRWGA
ncbi:MAG TPA: FAD-dependent oxidoreductase, partial [Dehalococcoidia bacterium]|nr:FAD-dependent oxidoreductase [Dehalococcoidia bacterium]